MKNRTIYILGNWKMYKTSKEAMAFVQSLVGKLPSKNHRQIGLAVPFTMLAKLSEAAKDTPIRIGAQNMHDAEKGAFTGEIAASMLKDAQASFVLLGHSERRHIFKESDDFIHKKVLSAMQAGLLTVLCIGETEKERIENKTFEVLKNQLEKALASVTIEQARQLVIAYEPVWAIGTGKTATPEIAQEAHAYIRKCLDKMFKDQPISILYGGSVKPDNIDQLMKMPDIDGVLVGGASLEVDSFLRIFNYKE